MSWTHEVMTRTACSLVQLCPQCCDVLVRANVATDGGLAAGVAWKGGKDTADPERHHMISGDISKMIIYKQTAARQAAQAPTDAYIKNQVALGVALFRGCSCNAALEQLGQGLHALQDKWAHRKAGGLPISDAEHRADMSYDDETDRANAGNFAMACGLTQKYIEQVKRSSGCCCSQRATKGQVLPCRTLCDQEEYPPDPCCQR